MAGLLGTALVGAAGAGGVIGRRARGLVEAVTGFAAAVSLFVPPIPTIRQFQALRRAVGPAVS